MSEYLHHLKAAVTALHGCDCLHSGTSRVTYFHAGKKIFDGRVETFSLIGHQEAFEAYAWAISNGDQLQYLAVLKVLPIWDASDAVAAVIITRSVH
ncbi:MAG: hypothetical protein ABIS50_00610 [Luteolibacter sp.]|uniref:hypothetical protein n=1 Tax=Luteolibacter sp. TaxID=1962973 RepID=UPI0032657587